MEEDYSKRELDEKFIDIKDALGRIERQTTATNGKVASLILWRAYVVGALAVLTTFVLPLIFSFIQSGKW